MRGTDTVNANIYLRDAQFFLRPVNTLSLMLSAKQSRIQPPCQEKATSMGSFRQGERLTRGEMGDGLWSMPAASSIASECALRNPDPWRLPDHPFPSFRTPGVTVTFFAQIFEKSSKLGDMLVKYSPPHTLAVVPCCPADVA